MASPPAGSGPTGLSRSGSGSTHPRQTTRSSVVASRSPPHSAFWTQSWCRSRAGRTRCWRERCCDGGTSGPRSRCPSTNCSTPRTCSPPGSSPGTLASWGMFPTAPRAPGIHERRLHCMSPRCPRNCQRHGPRLHMSPRCPRHWRHGPRLHMSPRCPRNWRHGPRPHMSPRCPRNCWRLGLGSLDESRPQGSGRSFAHTARTRASIASSCLLHESLDSNRELLEHKRARMLTRPRHKQIPV